MRRTLSVEEDPQTGDLFLQLTEELMDEMGWTIGDNLTWTKNGDGSWSLKKSDAPIVDKA